MHVKHNVIAGGLVIVLGIIGGAALASFIDTADKQGVDADSAAIYMLVSEYHKVDGAIAKSVTVQENASLRARQKAIIHRIRAAMKKMSANNVPEVARRITKKK